MATDRWVSGSGSDSNPGTYAQPWLTLSHAVAAADAGDTINVLTGNYAAFNFSKALTFAILEADAIISGGTTQINFTHSSGDAIITGPLELTGFTSYGLYASGRSNIYTDGLVVYADNSGVPDGAKGVTRFVQCQHVEMLNTNATNVRPTVFRAIDCNDVRFAGAYMRGRSDGEDGFNCYGTNITIEDNDVADFNSQDNHGDGIVIQAPWYKTFGQNTSGVIIRRNKVANCSQLIYIDGWGQAPCGIDGVRILNNKLTAAAGSQYQTGGVMDAEAGDVNNVDWINNTFVNFDNAGSGGSAAFRLVTRTGAYDLTKLRNNVFVDSRVEKDSAPTVTNFSSDHNDFWNPGGGTLVKYHGSYYTTLAAYQAASSQDANSINADPDLDANYVPNVGSPVIGAGIGPSADADVPADDFDGDTRAGATTDIGAEMYAALTTIVYDVAPLSVSDFAFAAAAVVASALAPDIGSEGTTIVYDVAPIAPPEATTIVYDVAPYQQPTDFAFAAEADMVSALAPDLDTWRRIAILDGTEMSAEDTPAPGTYRWGVGAGDDPAGWLLSNELEVVEVSYADFAFSAEAEASSAIVLDVESAIYVDFAFAVIAAFESELAVDMVLDILTDPADLTMRLEAGATWKRDEGGIVGTERWEAIAGVFWP